MPASATSARELGRLRAVAEAARAFTSSTQDLAKLVTLIAERSAQLLDVYCNVALLSDDNRVLNPVATHDAEPAACEVLRRLLGRDPIALSTAPLLRAALETDDIASQWGLDDATLSRRFPDTADRCAFERLEVRHIVLVPMRAQGEAIGLLSLARRGNRPPLEQADVELARGLADLAAIAVASARVLARSRRLTKLAHDLAQCVERPLRVFELAAHCIAELIDGLAVVRLISDDHEWLEATGAIAHSAPGIADRVGGVILGMRVRVTDSLAKAAVATGEPTRFDFQPAAIGAFASADLRAVAEVVQPTTAMMVALRTHTGIVGVVALMRNGRPYSDEELDLAEKIGAHAAQAIANARLFELHAREQKERSRIVGHLRVLSELSRELSAASVSVDTLLDTLAARLMVVVGDGCVIRLLAPDGSRFEARVWSADVNEDIGRVADDVSADIAARVAATGKSEVAPQVGNDPVQSWLAVPLKANDRVIGAVTLYRQRANQPYAREDTRLVEDIAAHAAIALTNAQLLANQSREIVERERLAARLRLVSGLAREFSALIADQAKLQALIARRVGEVVGDLCILRMLTPDGTAFASTGACFHIDPQVLSLVERLLATGPLRVGEGISGRVAATGEVFRASVSPEQLASSSHAGYQAFITELRITSIIAVPIVVEQRVVGVLSVARSEGRPVLNDDDEASVLDLAAHASLAIANSRLIEAAKSELAERMRTEAILRRAFLEAAPDAVLIVNDVRCITLVNSATEKLFGYPRAALVGQPVDTLLPGVEADAEVVAVRCDGTTFAAEISRSRIETPDGTLVATSVRDVTERRIELTERSRRVQEANRLKSQFLANMSHELRTPLNAIIGFTSLIHAGKAGPVSEIHKEYLGDILTSSRHLLQLINDILDLSKIEAGRMEQRIEPVDLERVVGEVRNIVRGLLADKHIQLTIGVDETIGTVVLDPRLLKQVLYNYLSNAIKFTGDSGKVTVKLSLSDADHFRIDVSDTGIGIKPADRERLFTEFQQLDSSVSRRHSGSGLGLALTKRIVEAQGGRVEVASEWGTGSTFSAVLPRHVRAVKE